MPMHPAIRHTVVENRWNPLKLGTALAEWITADRRDLITLVGSQVSSLRGVKTGLLLSEAVSGSRPLWTPNNWGGRLPAFFFDGVDDKLTASLSQPPLGTEMATDGTFSVGTVPAGWVEQAGNGVLDVNAGSLRYTTGTSNGRIEYTITGLTVGDYYFVGYDLPTSAVSWTEVGICVAAGGTGIVFGNPTQASAGNGIPFQATATTMRFYLRRTRVGTDVMRLDNVSIKPVLTLPALPWGNRSGEIWAVADSNVTGADANPRFITEYGGSNGLAGRGIRRVAVSANSRHQAIYGSGAAVNGNAETTIAFDGRHQLRSILNGVASTLDTEIDGVLAAPQVTGFVSATWHERLRIGSRYTLVATQFFSGYIRDVIYTTRLLTTYEANQLRAWCNARNRLQQ